LFLWAGLDVVYLISFLYLSPLSDVSRFHFALAHICGILVATMVMFTGIGAGIMWIPLLTMLNVNPSEAVAISIFTQIAGKGIGSFNYIRQKLVDFEIVRSFLPYSLIGVTIGYVSGFMISNHSEKFLLYIFIAVALYLLVKMLRSLFDDPKVEIRHSKPHHSMGNAPIVIVASFFTGLLSIGNSDWLIPHMERNLRLSTQKSVATGLFIMFGVSVFYLLLTIIAVSLGFKGWPQSSSILFATCSGVIMGGQIGTRLIRFQWLRERQKHAFILMLMLSIIHLLW
jgi:uncharacterized membrane protein YfcA